MGERANRPHDVALSALARRCGIDFIDSTEPVRRDCIAPGGVRLSYLDWGGTGDPIVFLHGGALTAHTWDLVCIGLRDAHRCVALDLRGHGDSDWSDDYRIDTATEDVAALVATLGAARCHLAGMSLGGNIAAHFAGAHPQRTASLTLVDVGPGVDFGATRSLRNFVEDAQDVDNIETIIAAALLVNPHADRDKLVYRLQHSMQQTAEGRYRWKVDRRRPHDYDHILGKLAELPELAAHIGCPVLVARGARSRIFSDEAAARCAALFARGEWTRIADARHNIQEDNPRELLDALKRLLIRVDSANPVNKLLPL
ncbi:MAG: alpha/beta fold hydrolase [Steroidobacteraceae bacterium]